MCCAIAQVMLSVTIDLVLVLQLHGWSSLGDQV